MNEKGYFFIKDPLLGREYFSLENGIASMYPRSSVSNEDKGDGKKGQNTMFIIVGGIVLLIILLITGLLMSRK